MSLAAPTVAEQEWLDDICRIGCVVCIRTGRGATPGEPHHLLSGSRRIGELHTICLCPSHHRAGLNNQQIVSRHHWKREFERRYGSEQVLLAWSRAAVKRLRSLTV